ncbi:hypothetical protein [Paenibacillus sp. O199]|uniref:hypothetical protein n=1 Tax=Paenibacillus sp. O199 TaxID=1643925 RepID=UPI000AC60C42|nr:hypothetical protein [Paenibacillus sp. O199]
MYSIDWIDTGKRQFRASIDALNTWMRNHQAYNKEIRDLSDTLYNSCGAYGRVVDYITAMPTLDKIVYGKNTRHRNYKLNKQKFEESLEKIDHIGLTRDILRKLAKDGVYFGYFETDSPTQLKGSFSDYELDQLTEINSAEMNCAVISLPTDYCRIASIENSSFVVAFDMRYFDQFLSNGLSHKLKGFPKEIREKYKKYTSDKSKNWFALDSSKTIALKVRADLSERWGRPIGLGAFVDICFEQDYVAVKRNTLEESNGAIIYQTYPEGKEKGISSLSSKQQVGQHDHIRSSLFDRKRTSGIGFISVAAGTELKQLKIDHSILTAIKDDDLMKKISNNLGVASSLLTGEGSNFSSQENNLNLIASELFTWLSQIEREFNKVINANIVKDRECKIYIDYLDITHHNREKVKNTARELYTNGKGSFKAWVVAAGFNLDSYIGLMDEELEEGFEEKYPVHQTSYTQSSTEDKKPSEDNPTNENTIKTKSNNANNNPSPKGGE